jgi:hypothetical protein
MINTGVNLLRLYVCARCQIYVLVMLRRQSQRLHVYRNNNNINNSLTECNTGITKKM